MQPDFSKMAQGQAAPQEQKMSPEQGKAELEKAYDEAGMPKGDTVEAIKQRVLKQSKVCLSVNERVFRLDEDRQSAQERLLECQQRVNAYKN